jgi:uncharacterized RDD family membrane protein YckC
MCHPVDTSRRAAAGLPAACPVGASGLGDVLCQAVLLVVAYLVSMVAVASTNEALVAVASLVCTVAMPVGLPAATETLTRRKTPGKNAMGLRTVRDEAGPISFRHAFVRALVGVVEFWLLSGVPALVFALVSPHGKRVGDMVAGTLGRLGRSGSAAGRPGPGHPAVPGPRRPSTRPLGPRSARSWRRRPAIWWRFTGAGRRDR